MPSVVEDWLAPRWTSPDGTQTLAAWYADRPDRPLLLEGFLRPEVHQALRAALDALPNWRHLHAIKLGERELDALEDVPHAAFLRTPPRRRWGSQELADPLEAAATEQLDEIVSDWISFVLAPEGLSDWIAQITGRPIQQRKTLELSRYRPGDYITPHSDLHDGRILGVNCYLGRAWRPGDGGQLGFENEAGLVHHCAPLPNCAALLPVRAGCLHWVEPWSAPSVGRLTASVSFWPES
jgi:hypothetical protein